LFIRKENKPGLLLYFALTAYLFIFLAGSKYCVQGLEYPVGELSGYGISAIVTMHLLMDNTKKAIVDTHSCELKRSSLSAFLLFVTVQSTI
jgi:hypothetical protein